MNHGKLLLVPATMLQLLLGAFFPCLTLAAPFHINKLTLFPDKNAWCEAKNITQIISHEGCNSISIQNRACMGQCFSYSVPKTLPQSTESLVHCDSCMPSTIQWEIISLDCALNRTPRVEKLVEKILDCNCHACEDQTPYLKAEVRNQPGVTYVPQLPEGQAAEPPPQPHKAHAHPRRAHAHPHKATQD